MTARELIRLLVRRWYLLLLGAALSVGVLALVHRQDPVYSTRFEVALLQPRNAVFPNNFEDPRFALAPMAGVLVDDVSGEHHAPLLASADATLYGQGIQHGWQVRLDNLGSQWQPIFNSPNIDVQVVDTNPDLVREEASRITLMLQRALDRRQDALDIAPGMRMTLLVSSADPVVAPVTGSPTRAAAGIGVVGATTTVSLICLGEGWVRRRRDSRQPSGRAS